MNFLLEITKEDYGTSIITTKGLAETLGFGLQMLLIGMLTVFAVLIILWIALVIFKFFFHDLQKGNNANPSEPVVQQTPTVTVAEAKNDEIIAVIAAAIAMAETEADPGVKFRVVSFKRK